MNTPFSNFITALILCVLVSVGYGIWYVAISSQSTDVANVENQIAEKTQPANHIASTRAALTEIAGDENIIQKYFVSKTDIVAFIDNLEERGKAQKTEISVLSVSTEGAPLQPTLILSLTINGTFDAVMRTVGSIEYAPYAISILELSLAQVAENSWHANLKLLVGSVPENTTARPTTTP